MPVDRGDSDIGTGVLAGAVSAAVPFLLILFGVFDEVFEGGDRTFIIIALAVDAAIKILLTYGLYTRTRYCAEVLLGYCTLLFVGSVFTGVRAAGLGTGLAVLYGLYRGVRGMRTHLADKEHREQMRVINRVGETREMV